MDQETRIVRYLSPSSLQLADHAYNGCLRKWWYSYVKGLKEPQTWPQIEGERDHACVEDYLRTGNRKGLRPRVAKAIHLLPPPGDHLQIEHDMTPFKWVLCRNTSKDHKHSYECPACPDNDHVHGEECKRVSGLHLSPLRAAGIPISGRIDLLHDLGINYGGEDVEDTKDPEGTVEVLDHKFTKDLRFAKKGNDLAKTVQMVAYGEYVFITTEAKFVRLSHITSPTNGNARKSTVRVTRDTTKAFWTEHVEPLARSIADAAKCTNPDDVPANTDVCMAFGRPCMHATYCSAGSQKGLAGHLGKQASTNLLAAINKNKNMPVIPGKSLIARLKTPTTATPDPAAEAKAAELAKLKAEEAEAKRKAIIPDWFGETMEAIGNFDKGRPQISGKAAEVYAAWKGIEWKSGQSFTGEGELGEPEMELNITDPEMFKDLLSDLQSMFPEDKPATDENALVPPDAPEVALNTSTEVPTSTPEPTTTAAKAPRKRTPKPKADAAPTETQAQTTTNVVNVSVGPEPTEVAKAVAQVQGAANGAVSLFVDVVAEGLNAKDFAPIADRVAKEIADQYGLVDMRMAGEKSPIGFGKWPGVYAAMLRDMEIEPGNYVLQAHGHPIYEEAANALRAVCRRTGGTWVRGAGR